MRMPSNDCDRAISIDPDYVLAYVVRGDVKTKLNDIEGAKVDLQNDLKIEKKTSGNQSVNIESESLSSSKSLQS